jgi:peptidyl-prolyl cis-trans isomerase D
MARKKGGKAFVWIILGLLFVGLMGFGATGLSGTVRSIGTVGGTQISTGEYQRELNQQMRDFEAQIGQPMTFAQAQSLGLDANVRASLVTRHVLDAETASLGISVGDARVREEVLKVRAFQGVDGKFDRETYRFALERSGMTEAEFERGIRNDLSRTLLQGAIVGGIAEPADYADALVQFIAERRAITWAAVDATMLTAPVAAPTDAELQSYYEAHPADFTLPETKQISYVWLSPDMLRDSVEVDDVALQDLYQQRIDEFVKPERRLVERLAFADDTAAAAAKASIDAGVTTFDALVADRGLDLSDVDLGDVGQAQLGAAGEAVFAAQPGDTVGPFATDLGPALFRMNAVLAAETVTFDQARPDLRDELATDRARRVIDDQMDQINDFLAGGATLEDLASRTDMQQGTISWTADTAEGIAAYEGFRTAAAAAAPGDFAKLEQVDDGGIFVLRVDAVTPPALQDFAVVRDAVTLGWTAQATQAAVTARANALADDILADTDIATLGLTPRTEPSLTRRSFIEGTPPTFNQAVFQMTTGEVRVIDGVDGNAIIIRLDTISPPDPTDPDTAAQRQSIIDQATAGISQDIFDAYSKVLQGRTEVQINQAAVNAVHASFQ